MLSFRVRVRVQLHGGGDGDVVVDGGQGAGNEWM
jgi:hypothetical protein